MNGKFIAILVLTVLLIGFVTFEQIYTENAMQTLLNKADSLQAEIFDEDLERSKLKARQVAELWGKQESIICLFVDFRDVSEIGKQANLIISHLDNGDFELAKVECNYLRKSIQTFMQIVCFDWQNVF